MQDETRLKKIENTVRYYTSTSTSHESISAIPVTQETILG